MSLPTENPAKVVYRPVQLNTLVRDLLEDTFPLIWVEGELGSVSRPASGHLYFTLKDDRAQIRSAMFRNKAMYLRINPRDGMQVLLRARVTLYEPRGDYQLVVEHMEEAGEGALRRAFEALKEKLHGEGLFTNERKRALPKHFGRLGILTSPSGAAVHDVITVLQRRWPLLEVDVIPVPVQGEQAAKHIAEMLEAANASQRYDVLLITRGGGSLEDLWPFNDEALVRAVAGSKTPVVSAVGHEVDVTLTDFAADLRAATPSAAAELLVPDRIEITLRLAHLASRLTSAQSRQWRDYSQRLDRCWLVLQNQHPQRRLERNTERLRNITATLNFYSQKRLQAGRDRLNKLERTLQRFNPQQQIKAKNYRCTELFQTLHRQINLKLDQQSAVLNGTGRALNVVNPLATLDRGYAILQRTDGLIIRKPADVLEDQVIKAQLAGGDLLLKKV